METKFIITDKEILNILIARIEKLRDKEWFHPLDVEGHIRKVDEAWDEYKAKYEEYKNKPISL